ncbi:MAG TPA: hypothetical protein DER26_00850 [Verrucomicrobia bacterium]|nr:hypothetical protein [Verrucomicrobiota bacterium]
MSARVLILTDGKAGHENQSKAFAAALGRDFDLLPVRFRFKGAKALSYLLDRLGIRTVGLLSFGRSIECLQAASYSVVIGTGSGTFYAAKAFADRLGVPSGVVLYPRGYDLKSFTCILAPTFDKPRRAPNVVPVPANLVVADDARRRDAVRTFKTRCPGPAQNAVAVVIGGPNSCATMTAGWMKRELDALFAATAGRPHWVTTSRRTPPDVEALVSGYPWDFALLYSKDKYNPIPAFVSLAKTLYVTAESTGMISEACSAGTAEVRVLDNLDAGPSKFRRFVDGLTAGGYVDGSRKIDLSDAIAAARRLLKV